MKKDKEKEIINEIFLDNLPRFRFGKVKINGEIDWKNSIGYEIHGIYNDINFNFKIISYNSKNQELNIKYKNKIKTIQTSSVTMCKLGNVLEIYTKEFKIEVGQTFKDDKRDLIITDRKYAKDKRGCNKKYYKYHCNKCGFECGEHYKNGEYKEELWSSEGDLTSNHNGCSCCANQIIVPNINSIVANEETQWMIPYFQGGCEEAKKWSYNSDKKLHFVCPDCGEITNNVIAIGSLYRCHNIRCCCGDSIPYSEKFIFKVMEQLKEQKQIDKFTTEKVFDWSKNIHHTNPKLCGNKRYDVYIDNKEVIIEMHGEQHYHKSFDIIGAKTLEEEQENDRIKKQLALDNGIKHYIVIDCRKSEFNWIVNNILSSQLSKLFDLSNIDWEECEKFTMSNLTKDACHMWKNGVHNVKEIAITLNKSRPTITRWLNKGGKNGFKWCDYDPKEETIKSALKSNKKKRKPLILLETGDVFLSKVDCVKLSEELFKVKFVTSSISQVCTGRRKTHKGFRFKYIEDLTQEEYIKYDIANKLKEIEKAS